MNETRNYAAMIERRKAQYGERFDDSSLAEAFRPYLQTGQRIKVRFSFGEMTGTVGVTTGWKPCFLLMRRSSDRGSSWTLSTDDTITAVQRGRQYVEV